MEKPLKPKTKQVLMSLETSKRKDTLKTEEVEGEEAIVVVEIKATEMIRLIENNTTMKAKKVLIQAREEATEVKEEIEEGEEAEVEEPTNNTPTMMVPKINTSQTSKVLRTIPPLPKKRLKLKEAEDSQGALDNQEITIGGLISRETQTISKRESKRGSALKEVELRAAKTCSHLHHKNPRKYGGRSRT